MFDELWESLDQEMEVPPALDPEGAAAQLAAHQRDTLLPPVPPPEYVQTMMELGEIDDPSDHVAETARRGDATPTPAPAAPTPLDRRTPVEPKPAPLGLVMAEEMELLLPDEGAPARAAPLDVPPIADRAGLAKAGGSPPRAAAVGLRNPPVNLPGMPTPRAPSVPPPPMSVRDGGFDEVDALGAPPISDPFGDLVDLEEPRRPSPTVGPQATPHPGPPAAPARAPERRPSASFEAFFGGRANAGRQTSGRATAPVLARKPTPSPFALALEGDPAPRAPAAPAAVAVPPRPPPRRAMTPPARPGSMTPPPQNAAGLRLGRTTNTNAAALRQQRDTPLQDAAAFTRPTPGTPVPRPAVRPEEPRATPGVRPIQTPVPDEETAPTSAVLHTRRMQERLSARDYRGALVEAEGLLAADPQNHDAKRCAESCREMLAQKYMGSLGGKELIPRVLVSPDELRWLSLDHRAGFLLSFVDGMMSIEEVLDACSMSELDALQIMYELREQGVIELAAPVRRPRRQ